MVKGSQVAVAAALLAVTSAMPTKRSSQVQVTQTSTGRKHLGGHAAYVKALRKFGGAQEHIAQILDASPSGVTATPGANDELYLCPVQIGSQTFQLDFDTGSSDLWVLGSGSGAGGSHTTYSPGSSAKKLDGESWSISYGDGSTASGDVYSDTVTIGSTTVTGQAVEEANTASSAFTDGTSDGLVGLAWDSINTVTPDQQKTFLDNAVAQGLKGVLSADLRKGTPGSYTFGDIPDDLHSGDITYTPVDNSQGFWSFTPDSYSIGGNAGSGGTITGIADTGTTLLLLGTDIVSEYYQGVQGAQQSQGSYVVPCDATLPDFSITVGGYEAVVPGSYINYADNGDGTCYGGIQDAGSIGFNIYGDIFLKSQFVVFDQDNTQLGLAAKASS